MTDTELLVGSKRGLMWKFGRVIRSLWNGPFHIGKLTRPVSLGEVVLKVLETLWRTFILLGFVYTVILALVLLQSNVPSEPALSEQVTATAELDPKACGPEFPLKVDFQNASRQRIGDVEFQVMIYEVGRTTNLARPNSGFRSDFIMEPGGSAWACYQPPPLTGAENAQSIRYLVNVASVHTTEL